jgi:hypothetical protein
MKIFIGKQFSGILFCMWACDNLLWWDTQRVWPDLDDLELVAVVIHLDAIVIQYDITETTIATLHDNPGILAKERISNHNRSSCLPTALACLPQSPTPV